LKIHQKVAVGRQVTVHALGQQLVDGKKVKFWSTKDAGQKPFTYAAGQKKVIAGWDDGVMTMKIGETAELTIPGQYGYGAGGFPAWGIKPNATLVFEIEVLSMK
jgi:peptidylprolyl isomerase